MKYVFVDFEMSKIGKAFPEQRKVWSMEIVEIGAVMLDESFVEISAFKRYVKPEYARHINTTIYNLTGIDDYFLSGCKGIEEELEAFAKWCLSEGEDVIVYAWSESDLNQILKEYELKNLTPGEALEKVIRVWKDLQLEYDEAVGNTKPTALHRRWLRSVRISTGRCMMPWMMLLFEGIVMILVGLAAIIWSYETVKLLIILIGVWVAIIGLMQLISLIGIKGMANKWFFVVCGVLALAFGILMILNPFESAAFFVKLTGAIALVVGILTLMFAFSIRRLQHQVDKQLEKAEKDDSDIVEDAEIVE